MTTAPCRSLFSVRRLTPAFSPKASVFRKGSTLPYSHGAARSLAYSLPFASRHCRGSSGDAEFDATVLPPSNYVAPVPAELLEHAQWFTGLLEVGGLIDAERGALAFTTEAIHGKWLAAVQQEILGGAGAILLLPQKPARHALVLRDNSVLRQLLPLVAQQLRNPRLRAQLELLAKRARIRLKPMALEPTTHWG